MIRGFGNGIAFAPSGTAALNVSDTIVSNNSSVGTGVQPANGGTVQAVFNRVQVIGNGVTGFLVNGTSASVSGALKVTITNSAATNNALGIGVGSPFGLIAGGETTVVMVSNSVVSNNTTGVGQDNDSSSTFLAKNTIAGNSTALANIGGGQLLSFGDNYVRGNNNDNDSLTLSPTTTK